METKITSFLHLAENENRLVYIGGKKPLVSIIVITYNSSQYVLETLKSIWSQTYEHIELVISDDFSTDDTVVLCKEWVVANKDRFITCKLIESVANTGITKNCNRGLNASSGQWVKIIAGDDVLEPTAITEYINYAEGKKNVAALFSKILVYDQIFHPDAQRGIKETLNSKFNDPACSAYEQFQILLRDNCVDAPSVMLKTDVLKQLGGFDETFPFLEDWPAWLTLTNANYKMHFVDIVSIKYRLHAHSIQNITNKTNYNSRIQIEVDQMFLEKYHKHLPLLEKIARLLIIYRNIVIRKWFRNRNNLYISLLSKIVGVLPSFILKQYRKKFFHSNGISQRSATI